MKKIIINNCDECQYSRNTFSALHEYGLCIKDNRHISREEFNHIPAWCPLEDEKEDGK